jgi:YHS domain-containing protein
MKVDPSSGLRTQHQGIDYVFCSNKCLERFLNAPDRYTEDAKSKPSDSPKKGESDNVHQRQEGRGRSARDYLPLIVIVLFTLLAAAAKQYHYGARWDWMNWMHDFMGFFLVVFSMFKCFDLSGFADGFQMYDLLAKPVRAYAYVYPFLELALGLGYLAHWWPVLVYGATVVLMVFGSLGVIRALIKGLDIECACMGTVLSVPLSTVALIEDLGMAAMAAAMLVMTR